MIRDLLLVGAVSVSIAFAPAVAMAEEVAPLPAGGPAAQAGQEDALYWHLVNWFGPAFAAAVLLAVVLDDDEDSSAPTSTL